MWKRGILETMVAPLKSLVHVGYPKTGTTTLQMNYFSQLDPAKSIYVGQPRFFSDNYLGVRKCMQMIKDINFSKSERTLFWSDELIHGYDQRLQDVEKIATFVASSLPSAKILICFRKQCELLKATYRTSHHAVSQAIDNPKDRPIALVRGMSFDEWVKNILFSENTWCELLNFNQVLDIWRYHCGKDNVKVMFYEDLRSPPKRLHSFFSRLESHFGASLNDALKGPRRRDRSAVNLSNFIHSWSFKFMNSVPNSFSRNGLEPTSVKYREDTIKKINQYFLQTNEELFSSLSEKDYFSDTYRYYTLENLK